MDPNRFSQLVATFMFQEFKYRLCEETGHSRTYSRPTPPVGLDGSLLHACIHAVKVCLAAFTRPGEYLPQMYLNHGLEISSSLHGLELPKVYERLHYE